MVSSVFYGHTFSHLLYLSYIFFFFFFLKTIYLISQCHWGSIETISPGGLQVWAKAAPKKSHHCPKQVQTNLTNYNRHYYMSCVITACGHQKLLKAAVILLNCCFQVGIRKYWQKHNWLCGFDGLCCLRINAVSKKGRDFSAREPSETFKAMIPGMLLTAQSPQGIQWKGGWDVQPEMSI